MADLQHPIKAGSNNFSANIITFNEPVSNQTSVLLVNADEWEIFPEQVTFEEKLGEGSFGLVYAAKADVKSPAVQKYLQNKDVASQFENKFAVKTVKGIVSSLLV